MLRRNGRATSGTLLTSHLKNDVSYSNLTQLCSRLLLWVIWSILKTILYYNFNIGYFIKYLDQANINNAFVSGMYGPLVLSSSSLAHAICRKEQLSLYGNELNYMQTAWTVGYVIGEIPSNILLTRIRPSIWIPTCEVRNITPSDLIYTC